MKMPLKLLSILLVLASAIVLTACTSSASEPKSPKQSKPSSESKPLAVSSEKTASYAHQEKSEPPIGINIKVTVNGTVLTATLIDNATTRSLISLFPLTVPMTNLYAREMVYRFPDPLPANEAHQSGYEVGDLSYWTPRHSFVIFYEQNGEVISNLQKIGRIDAGVEIFKQIQNADVKFELLHK